ncbi:MAG: DEAD/DEAH box helicase [Candidatus Paceibacterota bacterium]|jgi:superfamily II DNA/RNA helicase
MYQKHFRSAGPSGQPKQFNYRGKPASKGGFSSGHGRRFGGGSGRGGFSKHIDVSKFINKAVITEKVEHYVPEHSFADFAIDNHLKTNIATKSYYVPTPIQDKAIPHILRGSDLVGIANTGTGKTAAFLIPLIDKVIKSPSERVLIIVPTRELSQQIESELRGFTTHLRIASVSCVGGAGIGFQIKSLSMRPQFVIGTPGRLRDLIDRKRIDLSQFSTVVLDEADRMLDMGFIGEVKFMVSKMSAKRHTLFFSATMSKEIETLISQFLTNPVMISVKTGDTPSAVDQDVVRVPMGKNKFDILTDMLKQSGFDKILIFGKTKHGVQKLADQLAKLGFKAESIHGNKSQPQRARALNLFKEHHMKILVATDVAARGLDISGVSHVINYDIPATYEDYVHRIGRTGRAGKKGKALTFV